MVSVAFSYPNQDFFTALSEGNFIQKITEAIADLADGPTLVFSCNALAKGVADVMEISTPVDLESDYLGLFELNKHDPPLHLNGHLYMDGEHNLIPMMKRLQEQYQAFGMELKIDEGSEQPDHLTVELEFMAYLYNEYSGATQGKARWPMGKIRDGILSFQKELAWVPKFVDALEQRSNHPFYISLGRFLVAMLNTGSSRLGSAP